ncbi:hypothetical protein, partial [Streptomyces sp. WAC04114]|uniref:hypothetical protein n=1 Tax=Streptomyces sp. WAC04114 TaxID=2867961 RepID=UPI0027DEC505
MERMRHLKTTRTPTRERSQHLIHRIVRARDHHRRRTVHRGHTHRVTTLTDRRQHLPLRGLHRDH